MRNGVRGAACNVFAALTAIISVAAVGITAVPAQDAKPQEKKPVVSSGKPQPAKPESAKPKMIVVKQMALTEKQVASYTPCWKEINAFADADYEMLSPKEQAEMERIAKKHGYADFNELGDVGQNISIVYLGYDPVSKKYLGQIPYIELKISRLQADTKMAAEEKIAEFEELKDDLQFAHQFVQPPARYKSNIALIMKHYDELKTVMKSPSD